MSGRRLTIPWACGPGLTAAALLVGAMLPGGVLLPANVATAAAADAGSDARSDTRSDAASDAGTSAPTAELRRQLDRAQSLLQSRLAVLPADSGVLLLRDPDRLTLRIPARLLFEYDTPVLWQLQPVATPPAATPEGQAPGQTAVQTSGEAHNQAAAPLAIPLLATVQLLEKYRALRALIVVYTDSIGGVSANQNLADARAQAVYHALTAAGIAPERLQLRGAGAATMVADNQTPQGRIENRRVEIEFRPEPAAAP